MNPNDQLARLQFLAAQFRTAIKITPSCDLPIGMQTFPSNACGDSVLLLGQWLADNGVEGLQVASAKQSPNGPSHAWLMVGDICIDITADQFDSGRAIPFAAQNSEWHQHFAEDVEIDEWNWPNDDSLGMDGMLSAYHAIRERIDKD